MKKLALLSVLLLAFIAPVLGADQLPPNIGFEVKVTSGNATHYANSTTIAVGHESPFYAFKEVTYLAKSEAGPAGIALTPATVSPGFWLHVTPTLETDGRITLDLTVRKLDLVAIDTVRENGADVQRPRTALIQNAFRITVRSGEPVEVPLGEAQASDPAVRVGPPAPPYLLKLVATRL